MYEDSSTCDCAPCACLNCSFRMPLTAFKLELLVIMVINFCKKEKVAPSPPSLKDSDH